MNPRLRGALLELVKNKALTINQLQSKDFFRQELYLIDINVEPFYKIDIVHVTTLQYDKTSNCVVYNSKQFVYSDEGGFWTTTNSVDRNIRSLTDGSYLNSWFIIEKLSDVESMLIYLHTHDANGKKL